MARTKRIFISDIHMSSQERYEDTLYPSWYQPDKHDTRLLGFLDRYVLTNAAKVKDLILLGDAFNTWVCPADKIPPTYAEIFCANAAVLEKLAEIMAAGVNLFVIKGNHDCDLDEMALKKCLPKAIVDKHYVSGRMHAEHGHRFDLFNKADYITDPAYGRPIGYFMSRLLTSMEGSGYGIVDLATYLDDVLEAVFTPQNLFSSIIEGFAERAGVKEILMPEGKKISIDDLSERFAVLSHVYTRNDLIRDLYERRHLNGPADRLCQESSANIVVFGHTHKAMVDKDYFVKEKRIYANSGSWCKKNAYCVEIEKGPTSRKVAVSVVPINSNGTAGKRTTRKLARS